MKNKAENRTAYSVGRLVLVLFFTVFIMNGLYHSVTLIEAGISMRQGGCSKAGVHAGVSADAIQEAGAQVLCAAGHSSDNFISEQRSGISVFSALRKQDSAFWDARLYIDSFLAVLFKIAVIPCVIFLLCHFAKNVYMFLRRINCGFIHRQDGKKRMALSV